MVRPWSSYLYLSLSSLFLFYNSTVLVPLGSWRYLGPTGRVAGNGLPFPNPRPRTPLPSLAPTGRMWWPGMDCPQGIVPCRLFPLASALSPFPRCRGVLRLGRFRRRRYLAMYLYIPVCVALKLRSLPFTHPVYVAPVRAPRYFQ